MRDAEAKLLKWIPWRRVLACGSSWQATAHWNLNAPKPAWRTRGPLCLLKYEAANTVAAVWLQLSLGVANFSRPLPVITVMGSRNDGGQVDRRATLAPAWSYPRSGCFVMQFQSTVAFWWFCLKRKNKSHNNKSCTWCLLWPHVKRYCTSYHVYHFYYNVLLCTTAHSFMAASPALWAAGPLGSIPSVQGQRSGSPRFHVYATLSSQLYINGTLTWMFRYPRWLPATILCNPTPPPGSPPLWRSSVSRQSPPATRCCNQQTIPN